MTDDNWSNWKKFVLSKLDELQQSVASQSMSIDEKNQKVVETLQEIKLEIAMLKLKSGLWGAFAGGISAAVAAVIALLK